MTTWDINLEVSFAVEAETREEALLKLAVIAWAVPDAIEGVSRAEPAEILYVGDEQGFDYYIDLPQDYAEFERLVKEGAYD